MADFLKSMIVLDSWEGGYVNNPKDPGGETYCGISRRNWPDWAGWDIIDKVKADRAAKGDKIHWNEKLDELKDWVKQFYLYNFWSKQDFVSIENQDIADKIFQHYVNMGNRAVKIAQSVVNYGNYTPDGIIGPITVTQINSFDSTTTLGPDGFLPQYVNRLVSYYVKLIQDHPQLHVFETEWMLRAKTIGPRPVEVKHD